MHLENQKGEMSSTKEVVKLKKVNDLIPGKSIHCFIHPDHKNLIEVAE